MIGEKRTNVGGELVLEREVVHFAVEVLGFPVADNVDHCVVVTLCVGSVAMADDPGEAVASGGGVAVRDVVDCEHPVFLEGERAIVVGVEHLLDEHGVEIGVGDVGPLGEPFDAKVLGIVGLFAAHLIVVDLDRSPDSWKCRWHV